MNAIEIRGLKKYFGKIKAIDGISFEVEKGEAFGFLGPNGAGKTTTIRCMMNFLRPSEGTITMLGMDARKNSVELKEKIGYLPGNVRLYNKWTGWEHIKFIESIRGKSKSVDSLIKELDFDPTRKFNHLSSGNKQKLGLILSLMSDPEIIIMDEPTIGLDPILQNKIYEILNKLRDKGATIFISSHNLPEVEKICDRVGIIKEGKMVAVETLQGLEGKRLHQVEVRFEKKVTPKEFQFDGVDNIEETPDGLFFTVAADINPVLKKLATYNVTDLSISHADLEEVFLKFYEKE